MATIRAKVGVMGSAGGELDAEVLARARLLGEEIVRQDCILMTGACPGYPHAAAQGGRAMGGILIGISPGLSLDEHVNRYHSPYEEYDALIFTGSGLMGREIELIRSCDVVVVIGGRSGTLGEFAIAYDEGKLIGALTRTGGVADHIGEILKVFNKQTLAEVIYDDDPGRLIRRLIEAHIRRIEEGIAYLPPPADG